VGLFAGAAGWAASGWTSDPPSYSAEYKTPNESYPTYPIQYATPYNGLQHQNVVIVQPQVISLGAELWFYRTTYNTCMHSAFTYAMARCMSVCRTLIGKNLGSDIWPIEEYISN